MEKLTKQNLDLKNKIKLDRNWGIWLALWIAAITVDGVTTYIGMSSGRTVEGNEVANEIFKKLGLIEGGIIIALYSLLFTGLSLISPKGIYSKTVAYTTRVLGAMKLTVGIFNIILLVYGIDVWLLLNLTTLTAEIR